MRQCPTFPEFYAAVHRGRTPLPWQARLAAVVVTGGWPDEIGVPTGLGKTSAIDIAVWSLAAHAHVPPNERTAATRVWYVVNRRLLVDVASEHAERLAALLAETHRVVTEGGDDIAELQRRRDVLDAVADRLRSLCPGGGVEFELSDGTRVHGPLFVSRLRGGAQAGHRAPHPAQPAIICSTVPMYASRLLFRGYGASNRMWPVDAALAGTDSLVLLDEAHLALPLQRLVQMLPECDANRAGALFGRGDQPPGLGPLTLLPEARAYPRLVSLTATGRAHDCARFDLDDDDRRHPLVRERLAAAKPAELRTTTVKQLPNHLADAALELVDQLSRDRGSDVTAVVFANQPRTARLVGAELERRGAAKSDLIVLTGQVRGPEADQIRELLLAPDRGCPTDRPSSLARTKPLIVVATQTLEVGADLDFDALVSELASVRALTQRLGRLNRIGRRNHARAVLFHVTDAKPSPLYGEEPAVIGRRLGALQTPFDLGPSSIASVLGAPGDDDVDIPELLGSHLWEFAKTSLRPPGAAPPEVFFEGFRDAERTVSVCWRAEVPVVGKPLVPAIAEAEVVDVPLTEAPSLNIRFRIAADGDTVEAVDADDLRPGDRVIIVATDGGYSAQRGCDPDSTEEVFDLSPLLRRTVHITHEALGNLLGPLDEERARAVADAVERVHAWDDVEDEPDTTSDPEVAAALLELVRAAPSRHDIHPRVWDLDRGVDAEIMRDPDGRRPRLVWRVSGSVPLAPRVDALDELSLADVVDPDQRVLGTHLTTVGELAGEIAARIGLPPTFVGVVRAAARYHDLGKAHPGFQAWLGYDPSSSEALYAKSDPRQLGRRARGERWSGWPPGARHELLSVQLLDAVRPVVNEFDLVRHLVISHHGHGRPSCPTTRRAPAVLNVDLVGVAARDVVTDPGEPDWCQPERFRSACERFGYWGLALLEAILRQADHVISGTLEVV